MRIPNSITALIAVAAFLTPYGLQLTAVPKLFSPLALKDSLTPEQQDAMNVDIAKVDEEIVEARSVSKRSGESLVGALATARVQQLLLTRSMLENRLRAARGEAEVATKVSIVAIDLPRAKKIRDEIEGVELEIAASKEEAALYSGGLVLSMIIAREETSKLQLAQLKSGLYEAELGVPMTAATLAFGRTAAILPKPEQSENAAESTKVVTEIQVDPVPTVIERPAWADPNFPEIDYTEQTLVSLAQGGMKLMGWWGVSEVKAPVDDSLSVSAINVSAVKKGSINGEVSLIARCQEGETALIFSADSYLMSDYERYTLPTVYRIDDQPSVSANWGTLTSNQGVGLFGKEAENFLTLIQSAKKLFVRVTEKNGQNHDALFILDGMAAVNGRIKLACSW